MDRIPCSPEKAFGMDQEKAGCAAHREAVHCPVETTIRLIGGKYKGLILCELAKGTLRFSQLQRLVDEATPRMLTRQLRELERDGLVRREVFPVVPPRVEYSLTDFGRSVRPVLSVMYDWGSTYLARQGLVPNCPMRGLSDKSHARHG